jgi:ribonuclease P protein component
LRRRLRLTKNFEYIKVYKAGRRLSSPFFTMYIKSNNLEVTRFGISVSKKVGNSVARNLIKRRVKEIFKSKLELIKKGYDIVIAARIPAKNADYWALDRDITSLLKRGRLM